MLLARLVVVVLSLIIIDNSFFFKLVNDGEQKRLLLLLLFPLVTSRAYDEVGPPRRPWRLDSQGLLRAAGSGSPRGWFIAAPRVPAFEALSFPLRV